jgi:hypothetical protein
MSVAIGSFVLTAAMLAHAGPAAPIAQSGRGATTPAQTACSLMTPQEISGITGTRTRDGEPQPVPEGTECRFRSSSDSNWVHVALGPTDAKTFATFRGLLKEQAEIQAGVGDEAYFWGNVRMHVRVGTQSLTIGLARNDDGNAKTKAQVLALAKLGASRLR